MRSLLVIHNQAKATVQPSAAASKTLLPEFVLRSSGYTITKAHSEELANKLIVDADACVLDVPIPQIKSWGTSLLKQKIVPLLWWCSDATATLSVEACDDNVMVDGVLSASMNPLDIHWTLHFSSKQCFERQQWNMERKELMSRIEERKWIDMAKGILCELKGITESEAYDMLRKQAMNERKRMVDVATSIVKVYQLIQDQKGGAKR
ncbi:ANTAR domain-containing response regulator [Cohnella sp. AR92]|uniref:ANTAR domain-containing response regulator n=1 Tax=Cohnella sp. AR92 TaxID=648716 RepID=UPI000F8D4AFA|nr:ANTAR domain-containing protein [Cohnella sp. AR92]RUS46152.1 ANTAR domain-containing protein [Cohnella sp. AR92]